MLLILSKIARLLKCRHFLYNVLKRVYYTPFNAKKNKILDFAGALKIMYTKYPDTGKSCIINDSFESKDYEFDLEIIVPVYNAEQYITKCIDSIINQNTKFSFHVIIINDGSTDKSRDLLKRYECDPRIQILDQANKGHSGARNAGLKQVKGKYICFVDADDKLPQNAVDLLMTKAIVDGYEIVGGGYDLFNNSGAIKSYIPSQNLYGFPWGKIYKSEIWNGIQFPENYWFEDTICSFIVHDRAHKIALLQEIVYEWRKNKNSISFFSKGKPKILDTVYVTYQLLKDRLKIGLPLDNCFSDVLLRQFKINTRRIYSLDDEDINYANYIFSKELFNKYCQDTRLHTDYNIKEIFLSLKNNDYNRFMLACIIL